MEAKLGDNKNPFESPWLLGSFSVQSSSKAQPQFSDWASLNNSKGKDPRVLGISPKPHKTLRFFHFPEK